MTDETSIRVELACAAFELMRSNGLLPADARMTPKTLARVSRHIGEPVSASTFRRLERLSLAKLRHNEKALLALAAWRSIKSPSLS